MRKSGSWMWIQGRGKIVKRDANSTPQVTFQIICRDITKHKQFEEQLKYLINFLKWPDQYRTISGNPSGCLGLQHVCGLDVSFIIDLPSRLQSEMIWIINLRNKLPGKSPKLFLSYSGVSFSDCQDFFNQEIFTSVLSL